MGNSPILIEEVEVGTKKLHDLHINKKLCCCTFIIKGGNIYEVSGHQRYQIKQYAKVYFLEDLTNIRCAKVILDINRVTFSNVRLSAIRRGYTNGRLILRHNRIIGEYRDKTYDITNIWNYHRERRHTI